MCDYFQLLLTANCKIELSCVPTTFEVKHITLVHVIFPEYKDRYIYYTSCNELHKFPSEKKKTR